MDTQKLKRRQSRIQPDSKMNRVRLNLKKIQKARADGCTWASIADALGEGFNAINTREFFARVSPIKTSTNANGSAFVAERLLENTQNKTVFKSVDKTVDKTVGNTGSNTPSHTESLGPQSSAEVPTDEEWQLWTPEKKIKEGKPATRRDGSRYLVPLTEFEINQIRRDARAAALQDEMFESQGR